jgi:predicted nucleic acid-binding protein
MKSKRIILDTNLWISYHISKKYTEFDKLIESEKVFPIFLIELNKEFIEVVNKPKFK